MTHYFLSLKHRIWCLFEIWHTFLLDVQRLKVIARHTEKEKLKRIFIGCDVAKAKATVEADRDRILEEIKKTMPFEQMNENIKTALVESARLDTERVKLLYGEESAYSAFVLDKYGNMLSFVGKYAEAEIIYRKSLSIREAVLGTEHHDTAESYLCPRKFAETYGKL